LIATNLGTLFPEPAISGGHVSAGKIGGFGVGHGTIFEDQLAVVKDMDQLVVGSVCRVGEQAVADTISM